MSRMQCWEPRENSLVVLWQQMVWQPEPQAPCSRSFGCNYMSLGCDVRFVASVSFSVFFSACLLLPLLGTAGHDVEKELAKDMWLCGLSLGARLTYYASKIRAKMDSGNAGGTNFCYICGAWNLSSEQRTENSANSTFWPCKVKLLNKTECAWQWLWKIRSATDESDVTDVHDHVFSAGILRIIRMACSVTTAWTSPRPGQFDGDDNRLWVVTSLKPNGFRHSQTYQP